LKFEKEQKTFGKRKMKQVEEKKHDVDKQKWTAIKFGILKLKTASDTSSTVFKND
jgi:hypothetical protein